MPRYPLMNLIPADYQGGCARDQTNGGGSSRGFGYTARALIERRVTANWFVGTAADIQQAKDYTPVICRCEGYSRRAGRGYGFTAAGTLVPLR